jgi:hypothetical protein
MKGLIMKKEITSEMVQNVASELAFCESNRHDAATSGIQEAENYWGLKAIGIKEACRTLLGCWPAVYTVAKVERPYIVVAFDGSPDAPEFIFDANTFELIK